MFKEVLKYFKNALFPVRCLNCQKEGEWVCGDCLKEIDASGVFSFEHVAVAIYKENDLLGKIIRHFKYNYIKELLPIIEEVIKVFIKNHPDLFLKIDCIVSVPLHKKRLAERGFNQSVFLAEILGKIINKPVKNVLVRKKNTAHQARLNREKRLENVKGVFDVVSPLVGENILLVDDVFTTGSTIKECQKVLLANGAKKVFSFTLAKG